MRLIAGAGAHICNKCVDVAAFQCRDLEPGNGIVKIITSSEYLDVMTALGVNLGTLFQGGDNEVLNISEVNAVELLHVLQSKMKEMFGTDEVTQTSIATAKEKNRVELAFLRSVNDAQVAEMRKVNTRLGAIIELEKGLLGI